MKLLSDFIPIILFFVAYKAWGIYVATAVAIVVSVGQVVWSYMRTGKVGTTQLATAAMMLILGGATLLLQDETFVKLKPTAVYWVLALVFVGSRYFGTKVPLIQRFTGKNITLPNASWQLINNAWCIFLLLMGATNLYVVQNFSTSTWVNFKLFGTLGMTIVFVTAQAFYMLRVSKNEQHTTS
ncbi:MAG: septation protein A [Legionellales bacterium]|nr:MAG: septation protein A [Legionellales bacterium]